MGGVTASATSTAVGSIAGKAIDALNDGYVCRIVGTASSANKLCFF